MGITGLLPFLDKCTRRCHVSEFRGCTVAIDTYCWLHRGATACAEQLAKGQQTDMYVTYCMKYVKLLLSYDIHPIMVFDGKNLPAKLDTELKRRQNRSNAKKRAAELLCLGKTEEARSYLKQSIDITPQMANALMRECRKLNVDCIVAPYESDAQLAYFNLNGVADFIISEDSDLVLFGCRKVLYKMDLAGSGQLVESDKLNLSMNMRPDQFTFDKFRYMCILSGCDYLDSLPGIGLKKSLKFMNLTAETNPVVFLEKVPRYLNMRHLTITPEYKKKFLLAEATFRHQIVFDPFKRKLVPLTDPEIYGTNPEYLKNAGELYDDEKAFQVALGNLHPNTLDKLDDWHPNENQTSAFSLPSNSIWSTIYKKKPQKQPKETSDAIKAEKMTEQNTVNSAERENMKVEYDRQLKKELLIYYEEKQEVTQTKENSKAKETKPNTSPVLKKNPFLLRKKLSKFQATVIEEDTVVQSRFFAPRNEPAIARDSKTEIQHGSPENCDDDDEQLSLSQKENYCDYNETEVTEESNFQETNREKSVSPSDVSRTKKRFITDDVQDDENIQKHTEIKGGNTDQNISLSQKSISQTTKRLCESPQENKSETKRRKLGPCRNLGLQKQKSQPTLFQVFSQMNTKS